MSKVEGLPLFFLDVGHAFGAKPGAAKDGVTEEDYNTTLRDQIYSLWRARVNFDNLLEMIPGALETLTTLRMYRPVRYGLIVSRENPKLLYGTYAERLKESARIPIDAHIQMHFNAADTTKATHGLVGYSADNSYADDSETMAQIFAHALDKELDPKQDGSLVTSVKVKGCSKASGGYEARIEYCLREADCPSILMEPLFLTTPGHLAFMKTSEGFMALVRAYTMALDTLAEGLLREDTE